jgi:16S rRNA processing protein RimM
LVSESFSEIESAPTASVGSPDVLVAILASPFGVKGWVKAKTYTETPAALKKYLDVYCLESGAWVHRRISAVNEHKGLAVVKIQGIDDRDQAQSVRGLHLYVYRSQLPCLSEGEYYLCDLLGLSVQNVEGVFLGIIRDFLETGANTVMVLRDLSMKNSEKENSEKKEIVAPKEAQSLKAAKLMKEAKVTERLVPFVKGVIVKQVDLVRREMTVDWPVDF